MKELVVISGKGGTGKTSLVASLAALARGRVVLADCDVDAADLHVAADTVGVQRRLAAEGPGFGQILEEVRRAYAEHLLAETQLTMRELAKRLGYTSRQHFIRAFQSWSGMNPGTFRQKVRSGDHLADP